MSTVVESGQARVIPVDIEHSGLRLLVVVIFLVAGFLGYILLSALIPGESLNLIAIAGGFLAAYVVTTVTEAFLKRRWPSGRAVQLDREGVRVVRRGHVQQAMQASEPTTALYWRFQTKRRSRVPKGWHVLAVALQQEDAILPVYTFMSPDDFKNFEQAERFTVLKTRKDDPLTSQGRDTLVLAGEQRRLMEAETRRWHEGAEMTPDAFREYLSALNTLFPEWTR